VEASEILFLNGDEIKSVLTMKSVVETCDAVIKWIGEGQVVQEHVAPIRNFFEKKKNDCFTSSSLCKTFKRHRQ